MIVRTGRRELRALLSVQRRTLSADAGIRHAQPKRPEGISARQWKKQEKFRRRWEKNNTLWFGEAEGWKVGDKRIPCV